VRRVYALKAGISLDQVPSPKDIYEIGVGRKTGNAAAALKAFQELGEAAGDAIANAITLIDGLVVIGGGLAGASEIFLPAIVKEMNGTFAKPDGTRFRRLVANVYDLEDKTALDKFLRGSTIEISVYGTNKRVKYDPEMRIGIGISRIGTSKAIALGAYAFALRSLDS
jgi:glucokinase